MKEVITILGLEEIQKNYDAFILDQWGVMHDGYVGYYEAIRCVNKLFAKNKFLNIVSNSSKRSNLTKLRLPDLGFNLNYFNDVITSGEMIWQSLLNESHIHTKNLGYNCYYIYDESAKDEKKFIEGLEKFKFVSDIDEADFILGCTPFSNMKVIDFIPLLNKAKKKEIPFICANPDFETVEKNSNHLIFCMGTIAELYKNMGGNVFILGKPNIEIYNQTIGKLKNVDKSRILAIGDSLHHDIKGARDFGIDSLLITSTGIHRNFFDESTPRWQSNQNTLKKLDILPTFLCSHFNY